MSRPARPSAREGGTPGRRDDVTVRVVIVNWRQPDLTVRACRSIEAQLRAGDRLVVVDNGSGDDSVRRLRQAGLDVVPTGENLGFGGGVNAGADGMDEDCLVLLNNDAVAEPGFLDALTAPLSRSVHTRLGATTALILLTGRWRPAAGGGPALTDAGGSRWTRVSPEEEVLGQGEVLVNSTGNVLDASGNGQDRDWLVPADRVQAQPEVFGLCGGACAISRQAWKEVGGFRQDLFMYYEDTDLSWRLREAGYTIRYVPGAVVRHEHAASSGTDSPMFLRYNTRNRLLVALEHSPWPVVVRAWVRTCVHVACVGWRGPAGVGARDAWRRVRRTLHSRRMRRTRSGPSQ